MTLPVQTRFTSGLTRKGQLLLQVWDTLNRGWDSGLPRLMFCTQCLGPWWHQITSNKIIQQNVSDFKCLCAIWSKPTLYHHLIIKLTVVNKACNKAPLCLWHLCGPLSNCEPHALLAAPGVTVVHWLVMVRASYTVCTSWFDLSQVPDSQRQPFLYNSLWVAGCF
jgi:hypothetical protein